MDPIYPDKTKTGLAALKPLTDVFFAEPERWEWEVECEGWNRADVGAVIKDIHCIRMPASRFRLTPKPRRVWIGDQWYWEPLDTEQLGVLCAMGEPVYVANIMADDFSSPLAREVKREYVKNGFVFSCLEHAQQCLDAHRKARRVE